MRYDIAIIIIKDLAVQIVCAYIIHKLFKLMVKMILKIRGLPK